MHLLRFTKCRSVSSASVEEVDNRLKTVFESFPQHISIAVMFWFCGALGLLLELPVTKRFLSNTVLRLDGRRLSDVPKPPSWTGSFNPFPALVIGVTGLAMSAHHQAYVLAVRSLPWVFGVTLY